MKLIIAVIAPLIFIGCKPSVEEQFKGAWSGPSGLSIFIEDSNNVSWTGDGKTSKGKWMIKDEKLWVSGIDQETLIFNLASDGNEMRLESFEEDGQVYPNNEQQLYIWTKQE